MTRWIGMTMLLALAAAAPVRAELKIGVVDMQRALNDCDAGKKARDQVKAKFEKAQDQLKRQREDLDRLRGDYDKKAVVLKEEERGTSRRISRTAASSSSASTRTSSAISSAPTRS